MISNEKPLVDIIIPSMDNMEQLYGCLMSIIDTRSTENLFHIYVVNNGDPASCDWIDPKMKFITVLQPGHNTGWEGGLKLGLTQSKADYVVFMNDDTLVLRASSLWLIRMLQHFRDPKVAQVGPSSNIVMGLQNMLARTELNVFSTAFLIGFCVMVRKSALEEIGGIDDTLPGGDDLDLGIRFRDAGYHLLVDKNIFIFHYGMQTGNKLYGDYRQVGGWNSAQFTERTNFALIKKHGLKKWWECIKGATQMMSVKYNFKKDTEGKLLRKKLGNVKKLRIADLGCGNLKTYPYAVGVDVIPKGEIVKQILGDALSVADIQADVSQPLPFKNEEFDLVIARHILEHMVDPISVFRYWLRVVKRGGRVAISLPNEQLLQTIPMNPEHVHAWTPDSFHTFIEAIGGMKILDVWDSDNQISFSAIMEKL